MRNPLDSHDLDDFVNVTLSLCDLDEETNIGKCSKNAFKRASYEFPFDLLYRFFLGTPRLDIGLSKKTHQTKMPPELFVSFFQRLEMSVGLEMSVENSECLRVQVLSPNCCTFCSAICTAKIFASWFRWYILPVEFPMPSRK